MAYGYLQVPISEKYEVKIIKIIPIKSKLFITHWGKKGKVEHSTFSFCILSMLARVVFMYSSVNLDFLTKKIFNKVFFVNMWILAPLTRY